MTLTRDFRRIVLTAHVLASIGWVGIVLGFLAMAIAGEVSRDVQLVRASYVAMDLIYRSVVVPLGLASLITGLISSLGTDWGLFRHYWIVVKLLLTFPAVGLMLVHLQPVAYAAGVASTTLWGDDFAGLRLQLVAYAVAALVVLLTATGLSIYKPRGRTMYRARTIGGAQ
jgi:hypothetical protein